jgi:hypothetical protein
MWTEDAGLLESFPSTRRDLPKNSFFSSMRRDNAKHNSHQLRAALPGQAPWDAASWRNGEQRTQAFIAGPLVSMPKITLRNDQNYLYGKSAAPDAAHAKS